LQLKTCFYRVNHLEECNHQSSSERGSSKNIEMINNNEFNNRTYAMRKRTSGVDTNEKMSKISEEEYPIDITTPRKDRNIYNNIQKTTNDHIEEFKSNQKRSTTNAFLRNQSSPIQHVSPRRASKTITKLNFRQIDDILEEADEKEDFRTDESDVDKSGSIRKGRFNIKDIPKDLGNEYLDEPAPLNNEINSDKYQNNMLFPKLEHKTSSEHNYGYLPIHPRQSLTEYSLRERSEAGTTRNLHPFMNEANANLIPTEENLYPYYQYKNENLKTPMFTNASNMIQQNYMQNRQIPPLTFESLSEKRQPEAKNRDKIRDKNSSINYSEKEEKGSPRNSSYFIDSDTGRNSFQQPTQNFRQSSSPQNQTPM